MNKGQATRQMIIEKSAPLFNQQGYATSYSDLMAATGLERGGITRHFASKEELACAAFDFAFATANKTKFVKVASLPTAIARVEAFVSAFIDVRSPIAGGCVVFNTAVEHDDQNAALKKRARRAFKLWAEELTTYVAQAQRESALSKSSRPEAIAMFLLSAIEGGLVVNRLTANDNTELKKEIMNYLDGKRLKAQGR